MKSLRPRFNATIMIVDDSLFIRTIIKKMFINKYNIVEADSGEKCLELLKNDRPDVILLDINMAGMNGLDVLKQIRMKDRLKNIPIIMLTGEQAIEDKVIAFKEGANDYVEKVNLNALELKARVRNFLSISQLFRELNEEIVQRKKAERSLEIEKKSLEKANRELNIARNKIENNALEAGRIQVGAMVYHNIGNAITPLSIGLANIELNVFSDISEQLRKIFQEMTAHSDHLTYYVNEDPIGVRVFNHIQDIAKVIDDQSHLLSQKIEPLKKACHKITSIMAENQVYLSGKKEEKIPLSLNAVIAYAVELMNEEIGRKKIEVKLNCSPAQPRITLHPAKITQVVVNLLKNACESFENHGTGDMEKKITVTSYFRKNIMGFEIKDTGCGHEHQEDVFKFGTSGKGFSGFGLYYSRMYVEANDGIIDFESPGRGKGSSVMVVFKMNEQKGIIKRG